MKIDQKTIDEMIASAILWWIEKLSGAPQGLPDDTEGFGSLLAIIISAETGKKDTDKESQRKFAETLKEYLIKESKNEHGARTVLGTDYAPEWPLSDICRRSGVTGARFPKKTYMYINFKDGTVKWSTVRGSNGQIYPVIKKE